MSNVSSVTSHFSISNEGFFTTLSTLALAGTNTVVLSSTTGLTNGSVFVGIVDPGTVKQQVFTGSVVTGTNTISNVVWTRGLNVDHAVSAQVVDYVTGTDHNMTTKGILTQHNQDGTHKSIAVAATSLATSAGVTIGTTLNVAGASTLTGPVSGTGYSMATMSNPYKFLVYRAAAWTTGNNVGAVIPMDTKTYDTGSNFSTATALFTAPVAGFYRFYGNAQVFNPGVGTIIILGLGNSSGGEIYRFSEIVVGSGGNHTLGGSCEVSLANGQQVGLVMRAGGTAGGAGNVTTSFSGSLVSLT